ncbi:head completion/stabilization protein [Bordetella bronchialis]|uniref:head completion/stabilization protein n=1 Tax=Bordetella bronchialis TaxID=463025 RepID=UPI003CFD4C4D
MSFIASAPVPDPTTAAPIENDGFWPDVDLGAAREAMRLDGTVTEPRLRHALIAAIVEVGRDVSGWKAARVAEGYATAADVAGAKVDGKSVAEQCYLRAVYCYAKADLIERMADFDLTATGQKKTEWLDITPDEQRRNASWAISALLGRARVTVELI